MTQSLQKLTKDIRFSDFNEGHVQLVYTPEDSCVVLYETFFYIGSDQWCTQRHKHVLLGNTALFLANWHKMPFDMHYLENKR